MGERGNDLKTYRSELKVMLIVKARSPTSHSYTEQKGNTLGQGYFKLLYIKILDEYTVTASVVRAPSQVLTEMLSGQRLPLSGEHN